MKIYKRNIISFLAIMIILCLSTAIIFIAQNSGVAKADTEYSGGNGSENAPFIIATEDDYCTFMTAVNDHTAVNGYFNTYFQLKGNLDLADYLIVPVGNQLYPFKGHFNGNGFKISNIKINTISVGTEYTGLFGATSVDAIIENLTIDGTITGNSNIGGIVGQNLGVISNCKNYAEIKAQANSQLSNYGGICGFNRGTISFSANFGTIIGHGPNTGGIVGENSEGTIEKSLNAGTITSDFYSAGGIAGNNDASIKESFNSGSISSYSTVGGIAGSNAATGSIENTYNTGIINASNSIAGGISGSNEGIIYNSYNAAAISSPSQIGAISGYVPAIVSIENCFSSEQRFSGRLTFRGNDYTNSRILRDVDMANADSATNLNKMGILNQQDDSIWGMRGYDDTYTHYPELTTFLNSDDDVINSASENSVRVIREITDAELEETVFTYNGNYNEPNVLRNDELLIRNVDYSIEFENNLNAGEENFAVAHITFINYYKGEASKNFTINKQPISIQWESDTYFYNGKEQHPIVTVASGRINDENITFVYMGGGINVGEYTVYAQLEDVSINAINANYSFEGTNFTYVINKNPLTVEWDEDELFYTGLAQYPQAQIVNGLIGLDTVELIYSDYFNNINAGESYTVKVEIISDNYILSEEYAYSISKQPISAVFSNEVFIYNGEVQYPAIISVQGEVNNERVIFNYFGYENNINASINYSVGAILSEDVVNRNYFFNELIKKYTIRPKQISIVFSDDIIYYNGQAQMPRFTVYGEVKQENVDLIISDFSKNISAIFEAEYYVTISFSSAVVNSNYNFEEETFYYKINPLPIELAWEENTTNLIYNKRPQHPTAYVVSETYDELSIIYGECLTIDAGNNYCIDFTVNNDNYLVISKLFYNILPKEVEIAIISEDLVYNGEVQYPEIAIMTEVYDDVHIVYGLNNSINADEYILDCALSDSNYIIKSKVIYLISKKPIDIEWDKAELFYNGSVQYPIANYIGTINSEELTFNYIFDEQSFDVGINYVVTVELDVTNAVNYNYVILENSSLNYNIKEKEITIENLNPLNREYNCNAEIEVAGGELSGIISGDSVSFIITNAYITDINVGKDKIVIIEFILLGNEAYRYKCTVPSVFVDIYKAHIDSSLIRFESRTFTYDGQPKSIYINDILPTDIEVEYIGNEIIDIGEQVVTAHFIFNENNYAPIEDIYSKLYVSPAEYNCEENILIKVISGYIDYGAEVVIGKTDNINKKELALAWNEVISKSVKIDILHNGVKIQPQGIIRVTLPLDRGLMNKHDLKIVSFINGESQELNYFINGNEISFETNTISNIYIITVNRAYIAAIIISIAVVLFTALFLIFYIRCKRSRSEKLIKNEIICAVPLQPIEEKQIDNLEIIEAHEFELDGAYCNSYKSFLAALNYKDIARQKEICAMPSDRAERFATGKGNGKRRDLYWQGKYVKKDSREYKQLLAEAEKRSKEKE